MDLANNTNNIPTKPLAEQKSLNLVVLAVNRMPYCSAYKGQQLTKIFEYDAKLNFFFLEKSVTITQSNQSVMIHIETWG